MHHFLQKTLLTGGLILSLIILSCQTSFGFQERYYEPLDDLFDNGMSTIAAINNHGNTVVAGSTFKNAWNKEVLSLSEIDQNGNLLWSFFYVEPSAAFQRCMAIDYSVNNGYIITGFFTDQNTGVHKSFVMEINATGNLVWQQTYDQLTVGLTILKTSQNEYLVGGFTSTEVTETSTGRAGVVLKLDATGAAIWERAFYTNALTSPEEYYDFVETILEINPNEYYITGSVSGIFDDGFGNQQKVQKVLSAKIHTSGLIMWNQSFGDKSNQTILSDSWEIGADAQFEPNNQEIYLLVNNRLASGDEFISIYRIDYFTGGINSTVNLMHSFSPIRSENFHGNQLELSPTHVEVYGYAVNYFDPCAMMDVYYPFQAKYEIANPSNNHYRVHYGESQSYALSMKGFLRIRSNPANTIQMPRVHTPEMTIKRQDGGTDYYTFLSYNTGYAGGSTFELFDDLHGQPICHTSITDLSRITTPEKEFISFYWEPVTVTSSVLPYFRMTSPRLQASCQYVTCIPPGPDPVSTAPVAQTTEGLALFPNPVQDQLTVTWRTSLESGGQIEVFNTLGQIVWSLPVSNNQETITLQVGDLPKGWYKLQLRTSTGLVSQEPFIIE